MPVFILACAAAFGLPPQFPPYYVTKYHTQPTDHFNAINHETFRQRYLVNGTWWGGAGHPILFYTGAEGVGVPAIFSHSGYVLTLARSLQALVVFAEMRFFGVSMPFNETGSFVLKPARLGLLGVEQTIARRATAVRSWCSLRITRACAG